MGVIIHFRASQVKRKIAGSFFSFSNLLPYSLSPDFLIT